MNHKINEQKLLKILHIEDSPRDAEIIRERLLTAGFSMQLDWAASEQEFTSFLQSGGYDLVLADYELPGFDAPAALELTKSLCPGVPFICVSGAIGEDKAVELLKQGATDYVSKNRLDKLPLTMQRTIDEHNERQARVQAEEALRNERNLITNIMETSPLGITTVDSLGKITFANSKAIAILGLSKDEVSQMTYNAPTWHISALDGNPFPDDQLPFNIVMSTGESVFDVQHAIQWPDGKRILLSINGAPMIDANGQVTGMVASIEDITARKQAEEEKVKLEAQLFQSQKMEAIGTLAGGIAHDFNNILSVIIGYTELARDRNQKENKEKYLQEALSGAERAKNLVKQILTFSRQDDPAEKKPLDIKILLKEAIKFLRSSIPTTVEINQQLTEETCNIMADPTQMHQIIMNLCTNAAHAMKEAGGIMKIELANIELAKNETPNHPDLQPGHYVKLTVSDTGYGIDPAIVQRVFEPFFTTKSVDEGTGLGLSVVYGIVKNHGGVINVYSEQGKGAAFHVYLPRIIQAEAMEVDAGKPVIGGTERILFVDDEPALVDIGMRTLTALGYQATVAKSSIVALDLFRAEPQRFDLVITDMTLPKMTGLDLSRKLLQIRPDIPIILCSGINDPGTEAQARSLGIKAYLTKPLTKRELAKAMRDVLDGGEKR